MAFYATLGAIALGIVLAVVLAVIFGKYNISITIEIDDK